MAALQSWGSCARTRAHCAGFVPPHASWGGGNACRMEHRHAEITGTHSALHTFTDTHSNTHTLPPGRSQPQASSDPPSPPHLPSPLSPLSPALAAASSSLSPSPSPHWARSGGSGLSRRPHGTWHGFRGPAQPSAAVRAARPSPLVAAERQEAVGSGRRLCRRLSGTLSLEVKHPSAVSRAELNKGPCPWHGVGGREESRQWGPRGVAPPPCSSTPTQAP